MLLLFLITRLWKSSLTSPEVTAMRKAEHLTNKSMWVMDVLKLLSRLWVKFCFIQLLEQNQNCWSVSYRVPPPQRKTPVWGSTGSSWNPTLRVESPPVGFDQNRVRPLALAPSPPQAGSQPAAPEARTQKKGAFRSAKSAGQRSGRNVFRSSAPKQPVHTANSPSS